MYVGKVTIECLKDIELEVAQTMITELLEQYRYNGQIIGREFPLVFTGEQFEVIFVLPEQTSLEPEFNNTKVNVALSLLNENGLNVRSFEIVGLESQSDFTDLCEQPSGLILYTTYVQSCSPVRCAEHFSPVPLYKLPEQVRKTLIKWQESYGAYDQLQMNEMTATEPQVLEQLSNHQSELMTQAKEIAELISKDMNVPVYRYLYRVGGESLEHEQQRLCPSCRSDWQLEQPLHGLFDFKCDECLLVSNVSWDWQ